MNKIEEFKLNRLREAHPKITTSSEALDFAVECERQRVALGPGHPNSLFWIQGQLDMESMAALLEKSEAESAN